MGHEGAAALHRAGSVLAWVRAAGGSGGGVQFIGATDLGGFAEVSGTLSGRAGV